MTSKKAGYCERYGLDAEGRRTRLALLDLGAPDQARAQRLQVEVIRPNADAIIEAFYKRLLDHPDLKEAQKRYLLSLGQAFDSEEYFEERLRVGLTHARVGVPLSLYHMAYRLLQRLLIDSVPLNANEREQLLAFILKISALDNSLACETYYLAKIREFATSYEKLQSQHAALRKQSNVDELTGLANRGHILAVLREALDSARREHTSLAVIMADLDWFKAVNDAHGHLVGDAVLRHVAARLRSVVRDFDTVGRYGGEEFIIVLAGKRPEVVHRIAERIRRQVAATPIHAEGHVISLSLSLGVATATDRDSVESLITRADVALYRAKQAGRNQVVAAQESP
jgi:two-component system, cell cycle response regulator